MADLAHRLREQVAGSFGPERVAHDLSHLDRVHGLALALCEREGGDRRVIAAGAYLHDLHRLLEVAGGTRATADRVERAVWHELRAAGAPAAVEGPVLECVAFASKHSFAGHDLGKPSLEARIVRDADNLDAIGAVGAARALMYGGHLGERLWAPEEPWADVYVPGQATSVLHHFHEKLLRLRDDMLTPTARAWGEERHAFLETFVQRLQGEWLEALEPELSRARRP